MPVLTDPKELKVAKVKCLKELLFHTRWFYYQQYNDKYIVAAHHKIIAEALERVLRGELKRLIINIAPRYGKTELAVKSFISHGLALNAAAKFIHLSYSDGLALDNSEAIKDLVNSAEYQQMFPEVKIKVDSKAKDKWYTTKNGGVLARAAAGQVTGFGAGKMETEEERAKELERQNAELAKEIDEFLAPGEHEEQEELCDIEVKQKFAGAIIIDDPIKPEDADSDTKREQVNSRFDSTIRNRVNSRNTPIILIMQRLHPNDLAGYLQREDEADEWEVISLPCINAEGNRFDLPVGAALWPHKHDLEELLKLKKSNDVVFERQYMQNPEPKEGLLFPRKELHYFDIEDLVQQMEERGPDFTYIPADPAGDGGDSFASCPALLFEGKIYITDMLYNQEGTDHNEKAVVDMVVREKANAVGIEGVLGWAETVKRIREELQDEYNYEGEIRQLRPRTQKHVRITARAAFIRNNIYFRRDYAKLPQYYAFMQNLTTYLKIQEAGRKNKHDDGPDLMEMVGSYYERNFPELWAITKKKPA